MHTNIVIRTVVFLVVFAAALFPLAADGAFAPYEGPPVSIRLSYLALGTYAYAAHPDEFSTNLFGGELHEANLTVEYRPWNMFGIEAYVDFKGYYYHAYGSEPGYEESPLEFVRIWGSPNFAVGAGLVWHVLGTLAVFDISLSLGVEYIHYFASEVDFYPGVGFSSRVALLWKPAPRLGLGVIGAAHYSNHPGGPEVSDPSVTWFDFELAELSVGLACEVLF